jgi:hypothetical protein
VLHLILDGTVSLCYSLKNEGVIAMHMTFTVDEETLKGARTLPRRMTASRLLRHLVKAATYNEKEWLVYKTTEDCKDARAFLKPVRDRLAG